LNNYTYVAKIRGLSTDLKKTYASISAIYMSPTVVCLLQNSNIPEIVRAWCFKAELSWVTQIIFTLIELKLNFG